MNINRDNYESYFIDYLEGNLSAGDARDFRAFLLINADLGEQLEELEQIKLRPPTIKYIHKSTLKKDEVQACPDYEAIATVENLLSDKNKINILQNTDYQKSVLFYKKIKLKPDFNIHYPNKKSLYHRKSYSFLMKVAAILCLVFGSGYLFYLHNKYIESSVPTYAVVIPPLPAIETESFAGYPDNIQPSKKRITSSIRSCKPQTQQQKVYLPIMQIHQYPITQLTSPALDYMMISNRKISMPLQPEIYLAETASIWKSSEKSFLSDNIFTSMINTGKIIAEKIKNKNDYE